ncbi:MAG: fimbrillin family protein [Bacteroidales bacterium]|nr:fimbrillin family protein [Bacteroidales bacterium]
MRKTIHLALAIGAMSLLASCAQESIISREYDPDQIAYKAFANNATKSGAVDNDHLGNIGDLYISAIKLNDAGYYFANNVISSSDVSSSTANSGNTPYYWPAYKLGFYAANRSLVVDNGGTPVLSPYIPDFTVSRRALNDPDELMVALEAQQRDGNGTPVQLGLHHALSRLTIQVQKTIPGYDISVAGVQIGGFKSVGTFTFPQYNTTNATSDADWEGLVSANYGNSNNLHSCWGSLGTPLQYGSLSLSNDALSGTAMTSTAQNVMGGNYFYVIPQSVTLTTAASGSSPDITSHYIDLLVNVKAHDSGAQIYPSAADEDEYAIARVYIPASQTFEAGKSYTVTLNLSTGLGVSMSNLSLYNGSSSDLSSSLDSENFVKNVSSEFPDNSFILGSAMDFTAASTDWVAATLEVLEKAPTIPSGAVPGLFTVDAIGTQVYFAKGNLQCYVDGSGQPAGNGDATYGWKFADNQYDYFGTGEANQTVGTAAGWVDLFGWSTATTSFGLLITNNNATYSGSYFVDWGTNQIYNGVKLDPANTWRTLRGSAANSQADYSNGEWYWIFNRRSSVTVNGVDNARYAKAVVAGKNGMILFPDEWASPLNPSLKAKIASASINYNQAAYPAISISASEWLSYEASGCVFLPAAGVKNTNSVARADIEGAYWSSSDSSGGSISAWQIVFNYESTNNYNSVSAYTSYLRRLGNSVRLVRNK